MARSHKILIIDDDPDFVSATKSILEKHYHVSCAYNGKDGWQRLKQERPDLIILDVLIEKRGEGFIFSRELRKKSNFRDVPIIMVTGMRQQTGFFFVKSDPRDPKFLPVDMFMEKPVSPPELLFNIGNLLQRRNSLRHTPLKENEAKQLEHKAILIVEPNNDTAKEYEGMFREEGYDVEIVASVGEAVKLIKDIKFNCIIVDVDLPDMAGYDAVPVIKTIEPDISVIITAATNTKELEARVRNEDIFYYYIKSFDREELKLAVRNAFRDSRRRGKAR